MATVSEIAVMMFRMGFSREEAQERIFYMSGVDAGDPDADGEAEVPDEAIMATFETFGDDRAQASMALVRERDQGRAIERKHTPKPPTEEEEEDLRRLMSGELGPEDYPDLDIPVGEDEYVLRSLGAPGLPPIGRTTPGGVEPVTMINISEEESMRVMGSDPAAMDQAAADRADEAARKRRAGVKRAKKARDLVTDPPYVPPASPIVGAARSFREMRDYALRQHDIELAKETGLVTDPVFGRTTATGDLAPGPTTVRERGGKEFTTYDPGLDLALSYDRGEAFPPKGMTPRDAVISVAKGETPRPDLRSDAFGQAGTATGRVVWGLVGAGEAIGEDLVDAKDATERLHVMELHRLAKEALETGQDTFTVGTPLLSLGGGGRRITYRAKDFVLDEGKVAEHKARINSRTSAVEESLEEQREYMNKLLEDDPDFVSMYTAKLWRENITDLVNGLAQFVVYGSGAYPMSKEELEARGFTENFFASEMASKAFGGQMSSGIVAGFAKVATDPVKTFQTEGPTVILDALAFGKALKAGAAAMGRSLPKSVTDSIDRLAVLAEPLIEKMQSSRVGDAHNFVLRNFGEHSQRNLNPNAEALARDLIMESDTQRRIVDNVVEAQLIPLLEEGGVGLGPRVKPEVTVQDVRMGDLADGTPHTRDVDILPEEMEAFDAEQTRIFNERMRQRGMSRRVDAERTPVEMPSGLDGTEWRVAKDAKTYELTPTQAAAWTEALEDAMPKLRAAKRKGKKGGRAFGRVMKKLRSDLKDVAEGKGKYRPMAPEVVEAAERAGAARDAAAIVAARRNPWGRKGDDPTAIETRVWTEDVTIEVGLDGKTIDVSPGATMGTGKEQGAMATARKRINAGENPDDVHAEFTREKREGKVRGNELSGIPPQYRVTPSLELSERAREVLRELADRVTAGGDEALQFMGDLEANIARSIDDGIPEILRSKTFREEAAKRVMEAYISRLGPEGRALSKRQRRNLQDKIERYIEEKQAPTVPESGKPGDLVPLNINFHVKNSKGDVVGTINLLEDIAASVLNGDKGRRVMAESIAQTARRASHRRAQKHAQATFKEALDEGLDRRWTKHNEGGIEKPSAYSETLRTIHTYLETGHMPAVIRNEPGEIRRNLLKLIQGKPIYGDVGIDRVMKVLKREGIDGLDETAIMRKLDHIEQRMRRYEDFSSKDPKKGFSAARRFLRVDDDLVDAAQAQRDAMGTTLSDARRQVDIEPIPLQGGKAASSVYVDRSMGRSIEGFAQAQEAVAKADHFLHATTFLKSNMTARQLTTLKNNVLANVFLQALRRGDPLQFPKAIKAGIDFKRWQRDPSSMPPGKRRIFDAISRTGKIETSMVDAEITGLQSSGLIDRAFREGWISSDVSKALKGLDKPGAMMEDGYRFSDVFFKVEEGVFGFNHIEKALNKMGNGKMIELEIDANKRISLRKLADGKFEVGTGRGRRFKKTGTIDAGSKLDDIIARAAMRSGDKLFFDYFDVGGFARKARVSTMATVVSPFYTWMSKAMDVPGVKKGLLSEIYSGGPYMWTDDGGIQAARAARAGATATAAHASYAAAPGMYSREDAKAIREFLGWGRGQKVRALGHMHRGLLYSYNMSQANSFSATDLVFRAIEGGHEALMDVGYAVGGDPMFDEFSTEQEFAKAYKHDPEEVLSLGLEGVPEDEANEIRARRKWLIERGQQKTGLSLSDGLDLVGMAGNPMLEIWHMAAEAESRGRTVSFSGKAYRFAGMLMGGTYAKAFDAMVGGVAPTSDLTTRFSRGEPLSGEERDFFRYAIRHVTGVGWQATNFEQRDAKYHKALKSKWQKSIVEPISQRIKEFKRAAASEHLSEADRKKARDKAGNAEALKKEISDLIDEEIDRSKDFYERIEVRYGKMLE